MTFEQKTNDPTLLPEAKKIVRNWFEEMDRVNFSVGSREAKLEQIGESLAHLLDEARWSSDVRIKQGEAAREELQFIKSYLSHQDQDADHGFIVRRINDVLAGKDPSPDLTRAMEEMQRPKCRLHIIRSDGCRDCDDEVSADINQENEAFLKEYAPAVHPHQCITPPQRSEPLWKCACGQQWYLKIDAGAAFWTKEKTGDEKLWDDLKSLDNDKYEVAGFMSGLHEVKNFISFMMRAGTGEDFTHGYNRALQDLSEFIRKQETFDGKELLKYETRSSDGERVRKDRWETAIRNIAHLFYGPDKAWEIDDVVAHVKRLWEADSTSQALKVPPAVDLYPDDEAKYGRKAGMNRAPDDLPSSSRAAWLRHEASSLGQTKIYQPQYEELRVHAVDLWKKLKTIKEAVR